MNPEIISILGSGGVVVTATKRLSYEIKAAYDAHQTRKNKIVWPSAAVFTWDGWMQQLWQGVQADSKTICLNNAQTQQLLIDVIKLDLSTGSTDHHTDLSPLWNVPATAKTALEAWQQCHQWKISYSSLQQSEHLDHARFGRWATQLYARLQAANWISTAQLPEHLLNSELSIDKPARLIGFDLLNTQQEYFIEQNNAHGANIASIKPLLRAKTEISRFVFEDTQTQWQQIGAWARHELQQDDTLTLGIVCPDIDKIRPLATQALREQLTPAYFTHPGSDPFHFSQGSRLAETPLVKAILNSLTLLKQIEFSQLSALFLSAYWGEQNEQQLRARLLLDLPGNIAYQFDLPQLIQALTTGKTDSRELAQGPDLIAKFTAIEALQSGQRGKQRLFEWRSLFKQLQDLLDWQLETFDSTEYQAWQAWSNCLDSWIQLDIVCTPLSLAQAISSLTNHCQQIQFQAQAQANAPIQIVGVLEVAELNFDALWLAGFDEQAWPASRVTNPFIPIQKQIEAGIPYALPAQQLDIAQSLTRRLLQMCPQTCVSHARVMEDLKLEISPLMSHIPPLSGRDLPTPFALFDAIRNATPASGTLEDNFGPTFNHNSAFGGTGLIQKQSACPFAAYAQYRLKLQTQDEPDAGMDSLVRGNLLHRILASVWKELENSRRLQEHLQESSLDALVKKHVLEQLPYQARNSGLKQGFIEAETRRLTALVCAWLTLEAERPAFEVTASEQKIEHSINGLRLNFYLDRVDHILARHDSPLAEVSRMIIDYKSGNCELNQWAGNRPDQPQMPLYYLALTQHKPKPEIDALAFAQVKQDDCHFVGLSRFEQSLPEVKSLDELKKNTSLKKELEDWSQLKPVWQNTMTALVAEFQQGVAHVDPKTKASCDYCSFAPLCRIGTTQHEGQDDTE